MKFHKTGEVCGTCEREQRRIQGFGKETWRKEATWKSQS